MNILRRFRKKSTSEKTNAAAEAQKKAFFRRYYLELCLILALALILTLLFPQGKSFQFADLREGQVYVGEEIIADFTFPVLKSEDALAQDKKEARQSVIPVFEQYDSIANQQLEEMQSFLDRLRVLLKSRITSSENIKELFDEKSIVLSEEDVNLLLNGFVSTQNTGKTNEISQRVSAIEKLSESLMAIVRERYATGIINQLKTSLNTKSNSIMVRQNGKEEQEQLQFYEDLAEAKAHLLENLREVEGLNERQIKIAYNVGERFLMPNIVFDEQETNLRIQDRINNVPLAKDQVLAGERIIDSHQRLTEQHIEKLNSLAIAKAERGEIGGLWTQLTPNIGKFFLVLAILAILAIYLFKDQPAIFNDRKKLLLIGLNILFIGIFTFISNYFSLSPYIIPMATISIIVTIFFDAKVGLFVTLTASMLVGAMRGNEYGTTFTMLFIGAIAIQTVRRVRTRNWIIQSGLAVSVAFLLAILIHDLVSYIDFSQTLANWGVGVLNGFLAPGLAYLLVIILESVFDMTTDMTLLELSDFNHPLLRQLHLEAPGTYHHSYLVGLLAESATESLRGNALLARVGAYYHDIGKLEKPEYFVENQTRGRNPQEKLAPSMSSLILSNHVRRGVEIARQYGLPKEIEAFIYEHHGTSLMSYFYQKALEQNSDAVSENDFRYPGPRPQSRETAIVMLADAVEAASRTLKDPTPSRIKGLIEQIIDERFKSGELDDSPLTLRDLSKISIAFQKILNGRFHGRIDYPKKAEQPKHEPKPELSA